MRRSIALIAAATLVLVLSPQPADADHIGGHLSANLTSPGDGSVLLNRDTASVAFQVRITDGGAYTIRSVTVTINGPGGGTACQSSHPMPESANNPVTSVSGSFSWNTAAAVGGSVNCASQGSSLPAGGPVANGEYTVSISASAQNMFTGEMQPAGDSVKVTTGHAPVAPTGVTAAKSGSDIVVSWNANPEPDIRDYVVSECQSDLGQACSDWQEISTVPASVRSVTVASAGEGSYAYRVAARRNGAGEPRMSGFTAASPGRIDIDEPAPSSGGGNRTTRRPSRDGTVTVDNGDDGDDDTAAPVSGSGSVGSSLPSRRIVRATPSGVSAVDGDNRGFDELLPYASGGGALPDGGEGGGADERAVLIPLAGGALLLVLSGMAWYANRRSGMALEGVPVEELGDFPLAAVGPVSPADHANGNGNGHVSPARYGGGHVTTFRADEWEDDDTLVGAGPRSD